MPTSTRTGRDDHLASLAAMPGFLAARLGALSADAARRPGPKGTFSPVEQCWHLAELETEGFGPRVERLLGEEHPFLPDFPGGRLAHERDYRARSLPEGLAAFRRARQANLTLLRSLPEAAWSRTGTQEGVGEVDLADVLRMMAEHDASHRAEIDAWRLSEADLNDVLAVYQEWGPRRAVPVKERWRELFPGIEAAQLAEWAATCRAVENAAYSLATEVLGQRMTEAQARAELQRRFPMLDEERVGRTHVQAMYFASK